jgi:LPXTG-motif cell wall-anchored protein
MRIYFPISKLLGLLVAFLLIILTVMPTKMSATALQEEGSPLANETWVRLGGPLGGIGYDIKMDPTNPDVMYATDTNSGISKSIDGGKTWFPLNEGINLTRGTSNDLIPVFCVTIDPNNPNIIWVGLQDFGAVFRSDNGGLTWERRTNGINEDRNFTVRGISVQPGDSNVVYVAGEIQTGKQGREFDIVKGVVYKSMDGGNTWEVIWRGDNLARYVLIDPSDVNVLYVSTGIFDREGFETNGIGVQKSVDGGNHWKEINNGLRNLYVGSLAMHPENPQILLAGTGNNTSWEGAGVYLSTNGGENWKKITYLNEGMITSVEISTGNPNFMYAAGPGDQLLSSTDGGATWTRLIGEDDHWGPVGIRPGFPIDLQVDPRNPNRIFANNYSGGNFLSEDGGLTWVSASTGYSGAELNEVALSSENESVLYANGKSGPYVSFNGGLSWIGINPLDISSIEDGTIITGIADGARITVDPRDPTHILISDAIWGVIYESNTSLTPDKNVLNLFTNLQALPYDDLNQKGQGVQAITFAPSNPDRVYAGMSVNWCEKFADEYYCNTNVYASILISEDGGNNWEQIQDNTISGLSVTEILVDPLNENIAWAATNRGVFLTADGGYTWENRSKGLPEALIMDIQFDPKDSNILYAGTAYQGLYKSMDGGISWQRASNGMEPNAAVGAIVVDPMRSNVIYAGTWQEGVLLSVDSGSSWQKINTGLTVRSIKGLAISANGETLYAATSGGGVFRLSTHDQAYFDSLAPVPTVISPTMIPTSLATETLAAISTPVLSITPSTASESSTALIYIGGAIVLLIGFIAFALWRRKSKVE